MRRGIYGLEKKVKIGCCGFPVSRKRYVEEFNVVELQNTFYNLPTEKWALKIREEAPHGFEFTLKAWQVITHPSRSPTWRKLKTKPPGKHENYGWLKPSKENIEAFKSVVKIAEILKANIIVLQTPSSMPFNNESINWVDEFFKEVKNIAKGIHIGWEPRGEWSRQREVLEQILCKHRVIHVVDIFKNTPLCLPNGILYIRLHGLDGEINYRYKYSDEDLNRLADMIDSLSYSEAYIMFNNVYMFDDAKRLKKILLDRGFNVV